jgi:hypothetical protein
MGTHLNPVFRLSLAVVAVASIAACDSLPFEPAGSRPIVGVPAGGGGGNTTTSIEGTWQRTLVFFDDFGFLQSSETTWSFETGGAATRTVVTANVTLGAADTSLTTARWRVEGTSVIIDFTSPSPGTITLEVRVQGNTLLLAGQEYERIS